MTATTNNSLREIRPGLQHAIDLHASGRTAEAVEHLLALDQRPPAPLTGLRILAWFYLNLGLHDEAVTRARRVVELAPTSEIASVILFHCLWKAGDEHAALEEMKRFVASRPAGEYDLLLNEIVTSLDARVGLRVRHERGFGSRSLPVKNLVFDPTCRRAIDEEMFRFEVSKLP